MAKHPLMKFSILIANYNNGKFFPDCYRSIIAQSYTDWEAVILDDASTDDSLEVIRKLTGTDRRFKIYRNEVNSGVGITKSKLIELAEGDICGFVDPDDAIQPEAISSAVAAYKKDRDIVLTYSYFMKCDEHLNPTEPFRSGMQVLNGDPFFFNCPVQIAHFVTFRKDIYNLTEKMNPELKIAEDQDLYLKMYEKGKVYFINEPHYLYRMHAEGISQNSNKARSHDYFARVIMAAMKRRQLSNIHGKKIPESYTHPDEVFALLDYQNKILFRIKKKILLFCRKY